MPSWQFFDAVQVQEVSADLVNDAYHLLNDPEMKVIWNTFFFYVLGVDSMRISGFWNVSKAYKHQFAVFHFARRISCYSR